MNDTPATPSRRHFIQRSTGLLALPGVLAASGMPPAPARRRPQPAPDPSGQPLPELEQPLPDGPDQRIGFAVVGLGAYALNQIIPNLGATRHAKLTALVSGNPDKAKQVARAYGVSDDHVYGYDTFDRIADDDTVDVVYIILPNAMHREWTERAFAAGKHVLCEKPMAVTSQDAEAMIAAGKQAGKKLMIGYRAQFDPYNLKAIDLVRGEGAAIGTPNLVFTEHGRMLEPEKMQRDKWRARKELAGGGSLYDIGIYSVNGARYLLGEEPTAVTATYRPPSGRSGVDVEEGVAWTMKFPSGAVANCSSSYQIEQAKRIMVQGTAGEVTLDPATDYYVRNLYLRKGQENKQYVVPQANQFAGMLDEMALAVRENREPKTPGEEGLRDVRILEAIYAAAESGKETKIQ